MFIFAFLLHVQLVSSDIAGILHVNHALWRTQNLEVVFEEIKVPGICISGNYRQN
jgi:hypothetical protein